MARMLRSSHSSSTSSISRGSSKVLHQCSKHKVFKPHNSSNNNNNFRGRHITFKGNRKGRLPNSITTTNTNIINQFCSHPRSSSSKGCHNHLRV